MKCTLYVQSKHPTGRLIHFSIFSDFFSNKSKSLDIIHTSISVYMLLHTPKFYFFTSPLVEIFQLSKLLGSVYLGTYQRRI